MKPCPNPECAGLGDAPFVHYDSELRMYQGACYTCGMKGPRDANYQIAQSKWDALPRRLVKHVGGYAELSSGDIYVRVGTDLAWYPPQDHHCMTSSVWFRGDEFRAALGIGGEHADHADQ